MLMVWELLGKLWNSVATSTSRRICLYVGLLGTLGQIGGYFFLLFFSGGLSAYYFLYFLL